MTLDGYDISDAQFPPEECVPANVSLSVLNALDDVPDSLKGKYDVVHLRFWCCIVKGNDPTALIKHVVSLLSE